MPATGDAVRALMGCDEIPGTIGETWWMLEQRAIALQDEGVRRIRHGNPLDALFGFLVTRNQAKMLRTIEKTRLRQAEVAVGHAVRFSRDMHGWIERGIRPKWADPDKTRRDVMPDKLTAEGDPVTDLRQPWQRIRRARNGYIVELTTFHNHWVCEHWVCERPDGGKDDALEVALMLIADTVGDIDDVERVRRKLFGEDDDE